jgi:hypothetical protein
MYLLFVEHQVAEAALLFHHFRLTGTATEGDVCCTIPHKDFLFSTALWVATSYRTPGHFNTAAHLSANHGGNSENEHTKVIVGPITWLSCAPRNSDQSRSH